MSETQASYDTTEAPAEAEQPKPTYTVRVHLAWIADGQQIAGVQVEGTLTVPAAGDTQLINIPMDARTFAEGFLPQLAQLAMADAAKEARENAGKPVAVQGPALVLANGQPANRAARRSNPGGRGKLTPVRHD